MQNTQSWFTCKFTKKELDGKKVAFKFPNESRGQIGDFQVQESADGRLFIEVHCFGTTNTGALMMTKAAFAQDWIDKIERNTDTKIPADFIVL